MAILERLKEHYAELHVECVCWVWTCLSRIETYWSPDESFNPTNSLQIAKIDIRSGFETRTTVLSKKTLYIMINEIESFEKNAMCRTFMSTTLNFDR